LRTTTLVLVHSTAEYCPPDWYHIAHTRLIYPAINDTLRNVTGCLRPTPADILSVLAGIQPAELLPKGVTLSLACRTTESGHLLHSTLTRSLGGNARRLKSRHPFVPTAPQPSVHLTATTDVRRSAQIAKWLESTARLCTFTSDIGTRSPIMTLPGTMWSSFTATPPVSDVSALAYTNGVWTLLQLVSVAQRQGLREIFHQGLRRLTLDPLIFSALRRNLYCLYSDQNELSC